MANEKHSRISRQHCHMHIKQSTYREKAAAIVGLLQLPQVQAALVGASLRPIDHVGSNADGVMGKGVEGYV